MKYKEIEMEGERYTVTVCAAAAAENGIDEFRLDSPKLTAEKCGKLAAMLRHEANRIARHGRKLEGAR